jgi:hypothetical protein
MSVVTTVLAKAFLSNFLRQLAEKAGYDGQGD